MMRPILPAAFCGKAEIECDIDLIVFGEDSLSMVDLESI